MAMHDEFILPFMVLMKNVHLQVVEAIVGHTWSHTIPFQI